MLSRLIRLLAILFTAASLQTAEALSFDPDTRKACLNFIPIEYRGLILCVSADYYKERGIRLPVTLDKAKEIAKRENAFLPTPDIVDAIWAQADIRLKPIPLPPGPEMTTKAYFERHNSLIEKQLNNTLTKGLLIAGHKKDIVQPQQPGKVTIYGWHQLNGEPIQPVSNAHHSVYVDYSHGLRLVMWPYSWLFIY